MPIFYKRNYLSCQEKLGKVSVIMETIGMRHGRAAATKLPIVYDKPSCDFTGYDAYIVIRIL
jgi:hypothetical protein